VVWPFRYLLSHFWLDPYPSADTPELAFKRGRGRDQRVSPIYDLEHRLGFQRWVTADTALIVIADGDWRTGGRFRLYVSPGHGQLPYEVLEVAEKFTYPPDPDEWTKVMEQAFAAAERLIAA
jgi:hypothetical protein